MLTSHPSSFVRALTAASMLSVCAGSALAQDAYLIKTRTNELQALGLTGTNVRIGMMESGIPRDDHVTLIGKVEFARPGGPRGVTDHGTHVASILVGKTNGTFKGVAQGSLLQASWVGFSATDATQVQLFKDSADWLLRAPRPQIVNVSWGRDWPERAAMRDGITRVADWMSNQHGILYVTAVGNEGREVGTGTGGYGTVTNPGYAYNSLTVGFTGSGFNQVSRSSSRSAAGARIKPDIVAPGFEINGAVARSTTAMETRTAAGNGWSGSSFATPQVSGVAALLHEWGNRNTLSRDPKLMRAVIMNSANKSVQDLAGTRWDENVNLGKGAASVSNETGTGQLDAMEAFQQYSSGRQEPTLGNNSTNRQVKIVGWDTGTALSTGVTASNDYLTKVKLRKGTYLTSTLTWERRVDAANANVNNWTYRALNDMDLGVARLTQINTLLSSSTNRDGTSEHNVYKIGISDKYYIRAWNNTNPDRGSTDYALAWKGYEVARGIESFNGGFDGNQGYYRDNGWYATTATNGRVVNEAWMGVNNPGMSMTHGAIVAQELIRPFDYFTISVDVGFDRLDPEGRLRIFLGSIDLTVGTSWSAGIFADASNVRQYANYSITLDGDLAARLALLYAAGNTTEIRFDYISSTPGSRVYIDNVYYVPAPGSLALVGVAGLLAARRRR
ncbi:MAG: S8 family serine peptidase [Planctomycetota bacterium]